MDEEVRKKNLGYIIKDGMAWAVNYGFGGSYITPYALQLNANDAQIGLLTSVPNLVASLSQLETPKLMEKTSRKRMVTTCALVQALTWLPISLVAVLFLFFGVNGVIAPMLVVLFYTVYILMVTFVSPAWSSWMGDIVREKERGRFFARKNAIVGITGISSMLVAGIFLDIFKKNGVILFGFITLFLIAMVARLVSRHILTKVYEPKFKYKHEYYFSFSSFVRRMKDTNFGRFTIYVTLMTLFTSLASPFFAVYMLRDLNFSFLVFAIVLQSSFVTSVLLVLLWGKFSDKYGNLRSLRICGLLIPIIPILWLFSANPVYLCLVQGLSGFCWAGFNLASTNYIYDAASKQRRGLCFAYFGVLNGISVFVGATLGGLFATFVNVGFLPTLLFLFLISGVLGLAVSAIMLPKLKEVRKVKPAKPLWYFIGDFVRKRLPPRSH